MTSHVYQHRFFVSQNKTGISLFLVFCLNSEPLLINSCDGA